MKSRIRTKRVYEEPSADDGIRILVDRIWPRGISKTEHAFDHWMKDVAPSTELRKWFGHKPERWSEFKKRYARELDHNSKAVDEIRALLRNGDVTLVFAAKDAERNNAEALREYLLGHGSRPER